MRFSKKVFVALLLLGILFLPVYGWIVQVVNGLGPVDLTDSFILKSGRLCVSSDTFQMGDTLIVSVESRLASTYTLEIYENSSVIFEADGGFNRGSAEAEVLLRSQVFSGGHEYVAVLRVYAHDNPIPGVYFSDSDVSAFWVVGVETEIGLTADYNDVFGSLNLNADLVSVDGYPVANETVDFLLQFDKGRVAEGWVPVGSAKTGSDGSAELNLAFGLPSGDYRVKACHGGNGDYNEAENVTDIAVISNASILSLELGDFTYGTASEEYEESGAGGTFTLEFSSHSPYAKLPLSVNVQYDADVPLQGEWAFFVFFLDYFNGSGGLGISGSWNHASPYSGSLVWCPSVVGSHRLIVAFGVGGAGELVRLAQLGEGAYDTEEVLLDIQRCPTNIVVDYPAAVYGGVFPISVAVSEPRPYAIESTESYATAILAPQLFYGGSNYTIDEGVGFVAVEFYLNDVPFAESLTDEYGLASFSLPLNFTSASLRVVVDDDPLLLAGLVEKVLSFRKVRIYDLPINGTSYFNLNFTAGKLDEAGNMYVQVETPLEIKASFLDESVWNLPVTVVGGKLISSFQTGASGVANITEGSDFLRVHGVALFNGDAKWDGNVNTLDYGAWNAAYGSYPGHLKWDVDADLDRSNKVNTLDYGIINANWGKKRACVRFNTGELGNLDSQGIARIPPNATSVTVYRDGKTTSASLIEFFRMDFNVTSETDELGGVVEVCAPPEVGTYLVQVKLAERFDVFSSSDTSLTGLNASVNLVNYFEVVKRPVNLALSYLPSNVTVGSPVDFIVNAVDGATGEPIPNLLIGLIILGDIDERMHTTLVTNWTGTAVFPWVLVSHRYRVCTNYDGSSIYKDTYTWLDLDLRTPTTMYLWLLDEESSAVGGEELSWVPPDPGDGLEIKENATINVNTFDNNQFYCVVWPPNIPPEGTVYVYVNDTECETIEIVQGSSFRFSWTAGSAGVHYIRIAHGGNLYRGPGDFNFAAKAQASPVSLDFTVNPTEFEVNETVSLQARAIDPLTFQPLNSVPIEFWQDGYGYGKSVANATTNSTGYASASWMYEDIGSPHTIVAKVKEGLAVANVTLSMRPVTLTVGVATEVWLWIRRGSTSMDHTVYARLVRANSTVPIPYVSVRLDVNGAAHTLTTNSTGYGEKALKLEAVGGQTTTYQVKAWFDGTNPQAKSLTVQDPYGSDYVACSTLQYDYKPSQSYVTLTVEAPKTDVTVDDVKLLPGGIRRSIEEEYEPEAKRSTVTVSPPKTQQQMQAEAEQAGWLTTRHEFLRIWEYPWYRLHFNYTKNGASIDVGFNPALPGGETVKYQGLESVFVGIAAEPGLTPDEIAQIVEEAVTEAAVGILISSVTTIAAANTRIPFATPIALGVYAAGLSAMIGYAWYLYSSGARTKAKAFLTGLIVDLWGVTLAAFMTVRAAFITGMVAAILASAFSSLFDSASLRAAIIATTAAMYVSIGIGMAALFLVPEPSSMAFKLAFPWISLLFAAIALNMLAVLNI